MKEAIVRQGWSNWLVLVGTKHPYRGLIHLDIMDRFDTREEAEKKCNLANYIFNKCKEYSNRYQIIHSSSERSIKCGS